MNGDQSLPDYYWRLAHETYDKGIIAWIEYLKAAGTAPYRLPQTWPTEFLITAIAIALAEERRLGVKEGEAR